MSIEISAKIICDGCKKEVIGPTEHRAGHISKPLWDAKRIASNQGWISMGRGRYYPKAHYCKDCQDKPITPIPRKKPNKANVPLGWVHDPEF